MLSGLASGILVGRVLIFQKANVYFLADPVRLFVAISEPGYFHLESKPKSLTGLRTQNDKTPNWSIY